MHKEDHEVYPMMVEAARGMLRWIGLDDAGVTIQIGLLSPANRKRVPRGAEFGKTDLPTRTITIDPRIRFCELPAALAHEGAHILSGTYAHDCSEFKVAHYKLLGIDCYDDPPEEQMMEWGEE